MDRDGGGGAMAQAAQIQQVLGQIRNYENQNRVFSDVSTLLRHIPSLVPKPRELFQTDGSISNLMCLDGTVPITYRGSTYNIPVEVYLKLGFPREPPICYVRPTATMFVKSGHPHVDTEGLVWLPYLHEWRETSHSLLPLCQEMQRVFSTDPPVHAKPTAQRQQPPPPSYSAIQQPSPAVAFSTYAQPASAAVGPKEEAVHAVTTKLKSDLGGFYEAICREIEDENRKQIDLKAGHEEVVSSVEKLRKHKQVLEEQIQLAQASNGALDDWLVRRQEADQIPVDPDELIQPADACSQKMLELVAESAAMDDALFALDRGLAQGNIEAAQFLSEVRKLSRKQFLCYAHIKKILKVQRGQL